MTDDTTGSRCEARLPVADGSPLFPGGRFSTITSGVADFQRSHMRKWPVSETIAPGWPISQDHMADFSVDNHKSLQVRLTIARFCQLRCLLSIRPP